MPILTTIRQSPTYLYVKVYCLCSLVTLFQAAPVSSRIPQLGQRLQLNKYRIINTRLGPRIVPIEESLPSSTSEASDVTLPNAQKISGLENASSTEVIISPDVLGSHGRQSRFRVLLRRWAQRLKDLKQVHQLLKADEADIKAYPELAWDATVRRSSFLHGEETRFIAKRRRRMSMQGDNSLNRFLELAPDEEVHPQDVPLVALGGSGGGYRAMYGYAAFMSASKRSGLWDCLTWVAGVSGSCWALAAYYTIAYQDVGRLIKHYLATASELAHPMSVYALDTVARSSRGVYFLLGPLIRKAQAGIVGLGIMDLYATLTTTYQFLSREPRARLSRATFQFSKVWNRSGVAAGKEPMPIFTAVRVAPKDAVGVRPHTDSSLSKGQPPKRALSQHQTAASKAIADRRKKKVGISDDNSAAVTAATIQHNQNAESPTDVYSVPVTKGFFQWFEATPLEIGSADVQAYIPTWAWGRPFVSGRSLDRRPEESLSLLLGQCTSAPAGPLTGYISALLASLPRGTAMSRILLLLNNFVRMKHWERRWGNPIRAGDEPNPFYGLNVRPVSKELEAKTPIPRVLGIGVDILHMPRLEALVVRHTHRMLHRQGLVAGMPAVTDRIEALSKVANRILCRSELVEWNTNIDSSTVDEEQKYNMLKRYLAVRWCAKEAAYKALYPTHLVSWKDLCVHKTAVRSAEDGPIDGVDLSRLELHGYRTRKPSLHFSQDWLSKHPDTESIPKLHLSISHDGEYVVANVLAEQTSGKGREKKTPRSRGVGEVSSTQQLDWDQVKVKLPLPGSRDSAWAGDVVDPGEDAEGQPIINESDLPEVPSSWESQGRIRLMDSGMSNNLPNHILARKERGADIILAFDASSDVQAGSAIRRIQNFAEDCQIDLVDESHLFEATTPSPNLHVGKAKELEDRFIDQYAKVLRGTRQEDGSTFWLIYCPLLPNPINPEYDPSTSSFSNSYNLVWTPSQVKTLLRTSEANLEVYALQTIKQVMRRVYEEKKAKRLASANNPTPPSGRESTAHPASNQQY